jgi:uncharacterized membrane protein YcaP (DUF421 family)
VSWLSRYRGSGPAIARVKPGPLRILVVRGRVCRRQLRICRLTEDDLMSAMRQQGVGQFNQVSLALYEQAGRLTIVPTRDHGGQLVVTTLAAPVPSPRAGWRTRRAAL